jgi:hypothetical protein
MLSRYVLQERGDGHLVANVILMVGSIGQVKKEKIICPGYGRYRHHRKPKCARRGGVSERGREKKKKRSQ